MAQIEFIYNGITTIILCQYKEKFEDILQKLSLKIKIDLDSVYFLYSGKVINNRTLTIEKIINSLDKLSNRMNIQIVDNENKEENDIITKSTYVICPECKERAKIRIKNYRIRIYDCINKHDKNISLEEYEKTQKINLSQIICNECKLKNKGNSYKQIFYRCNTCKKNICPICKEKHQENHNIINFDEKNYICEKHNYPFALYCKTCKINSVRVYKFLLIHYKFIRINNYLTLLEFLYLFEVNDICILCENEHDNHETISFGKIIPNKEKIKNNMKEFKNKIDLFNKNIKEIINKLNKIIINIEILYKIYEDILKNNNFKNYENLHNLNNIKEEIYIKDLNEIIEDNNMNNKFKNLMNIHDKIMNIEPIEINNNLNINGDFMENLSLNNNNLNDNNMNMNNANNMNMNFNNNMNMNNVNNMNMNFDNNMNMNNFNNMNMNFGNNMNMNFDNNMNKNNINNKNMYNFNKIGVCSNFPNMNINNFNNMKNNTCINNNFNFPFMNENNNSDRENNQEKEELIFVTFTFKKNKKQIYIDVDKNETFRGALIILEDKYDWLKTIPNIRYTFKNKIIRASDYGKKLCQLGIDEYSDIFMLTD